MPSLTLLGSREGQHIRIRRWQYVEPHGSHRRVSCSRSNRNHLRAIGADGSDVNQRFLKENFKVDRVQVLNAGAWVGVIGTLLPFAAGLSGAATGQLLSGSQMTAGSASTGMTTGGGGVAVGGAFARTMGYGARGTALPARAAERQTMESALQNPFPTASQSVGVVRGSHPMWRRCAQASAQVRAGARSEPRMADAANAAH